MNETAGGLQIRGQYQLHHLTWTIVDKLPLLMRTQGKRIVLDALRYGCQHKGLHIYAYVMMSNHIHLIAAVAPDSGGLSKVVGQLKSHSSKQLMAWLAQSDAPENAVYLKHLLHRAELTGERNIWQRGNGAQTLLYPRFTQQKLNYVHLNPVRAGIVYEANEYVYSSAAQYAGRKGEFPLVVELLELDTGDGYLPTKGLGR